MQMKKINSGGLRAIVYDAPVQMLQVQLDDGSTLKYGGVGEDIWRRLSSSGAARINGLRLKTIQGDQAC